MCDLLAWLLAQQESFQAHPLSSPCTWPPRCRATHSFSLNERKKECLSIGVTSRQVATMMSRSSRCECSMLWKTRLRSAAQMFRHPPIHAHTYAYAHHHHHHHHHHHLATHKRAHAHTSLSLSLSFSLSFSFFLSHTHLGRGRGAHARARYFNPPHSERHHVSVPRNTRPSSRSGCVPTRPAGHRRIGIGIGIGIGIAASSVCEAAGMPMPMPHTHTRAHTQS